MKIFTKLVLASSIALSGSAMAMQSMDDAALSATTGQDGLTISVSTGANSALNGDKGTYIDKVYIHDNDGLAAAGAAGDAGYGGTATAGAIILSNIAVKQNANSTGPMATLVIDTDSGSGNAFINVAANLAAVDISVGDISVGSSGTLNTTTATRGTTGTSSTILSNLNLQMGASTANIQLGNSPQGALIKLNSEITGGLNLNGLTVNDNTGGGSITLDNIYVRGADNTNGNLAANTSISVASNGLKIQNNSDQAMNVYIAGVHLGSSTASSIGDVEISGLRTGTSTITVSGH